MIKLSDIIKDGRGNKECAKGHPDLNPAQPHLKRRDGICHPDCYFVLHGKRSSRTTVQNGVPIHGIFLPGNQLDSWYLYNVHDYSYYGHLRGNWRFGNDFSAIL